MQGKSQKDLALKNIFIQFVAFSYIGCYDEPMGVAIAICMKSGGIPDD